MATTTKTRQPAAAPTKVAPTQARNINRGYLTGGLLFLALSGLMGGLLLGRRGETQTVWVAGSELGAQHVLVASDLEPLVVPSDVDLTGIDTSQSLDGRVLRIPTPAGAVIAPTALYPVGDTFEADGRSEVGMRIPAGRAPAGLRVGDEVTVVEIPTTSQDPVLLELVTGTVVSVSQENADEFASMLIVLAVEESQATQVARAAALDRVALVVSGRN